MTGSTQWVEKWNALCKRNVGGCLESLLVKISKIAITEAMEKYDKVIWRNVNSGNELDFPKILHGTHTQKRERSVLVACGFIYVTYGTNWGELLKHMECWMFLGHFWIPQSCNHSQQYSWEYSHSYISILVRSISIFWQRSLVLTFVPSSRAKLSVHFSCPADLIFQPSLQ